MPILRHRFACAVLLLPVMCVACDSSPPRGAVSGKVLLDGKSVENATVVFQPAHGPASYGITDANGVYRLRQSKDIDGAEIGPHDVTIGTYRIVTNEAGEPVEHLETLPEQFNDRSELVREVKPGEQTIDFELVTPR